MRIHPHIDVTPNFPTVQFREERSLIDLEAELAKVVNYQRWSCGLYFNVQFVNHDRTKLLQSALFVVSEENESVNVNNDNPYSPKTQITSARKAVQIGEWWYSGAVFDEAAIEPPTPQVVVEFDDSVWQGIDAANAIRKWNPGKQQHEVWVHDELVYASPHKNKATAVSEGRDPEHL
jgi:hypothetical protein